MLNENIVKNIHSLLRRIQSNPAFAVNSNGRHLAAIEFSSKEFTHHIKIKQSIQNVLMLKFKDQFETNILTPIY